MSDRLAALKKLSSVFIDGHALSMNDNDSPFTKALCFEVCRYVYALEKITSVLLRKPLKAKDQDLALIIYIGLIQIEKMDVKDHAAINECVALVKKAGKKSATGLVNAVLRGYQRDRENLAKIFTLPKYQAPAWLLEQLKSDYPEDWQRIVEANLQHAPMFIRVKPASAEDSNASSPESSNAPSSRGLTAGSSSQQLEPCCIENAYQLKTPTPVHNLPGFSKGDCSVQDLSPQCAAGLLDLENGQRVLDACAAPGNKSAHLLETADVQLTCLDIDEKRLERLTENLKRCQVSAEVLCAPAEETDKWWDEKPFDRILLDAPCSATGVIRRHPDIQILRRETDIAVLNETQLSVLKALWKTLKPGGVLLYATCSVLKSENEGVIEKFLADASGAQAQPIELPFGKPQQHGWQTLPGDANADGFYYCKLMKLLS